MRWILLPSNVNAMMKKKLFLAALLLLGLGLTSCGQEDSPIMHQRATTGERITLSVDFAPEAESNHRAKAVFSQEATEPVTLVFYHGGKAYPVESQISLKNVNGHYRGDRRRG